MMRLPLVAVAAAVLVLAGCGGGDEPAPAEESTASESAQASQPPTEPAVWPLTGLPVQDGGDGVPEHPVYVVKIDNTSNAKPQVGLSSADLVVEELVEGGSTRLAAFYHSDLPEDVGPVRSMRASDIGIVKPVDATVITSGAATRTYKRLRDAGVAWLEEGTDGIRREGGRRAPYNVFADLTAIAKGAKAPGKRAPDYLAWGVREDLPQGAPASTVAASFSGGHTTRWTFVDGAYTRDNSLAAPGDAFKADTVLVVRAELGDAGYRDPAGNPVPETKFEGSGTAVLFHNGLAVEGTWSKRGVGDQLVLTTADGAELKVPAGRTWIELVPQGSGSVSWK